MEGHLVDEVDQQREAVHSSKVPQLDETRASVVMNICESHHLGVSCDTEDAEGSRGVSGGPAQGGDVGATMETQCPVEDRSAEHVIGPFNATLIVPYPSELRDGQRRRPYAPLTVSLPETDRTD